jgi:AraC-like DNA-binding protein
VSNTPGARANYAETMVFDHAGVRAGILACSPQYPAFRDLGPAANYVVAFPTSPIVLTPVGGRSFVGTPGTAVLMNRGMRVLRTALAPAGDRCCWIGLDEDVAEAVARATAGTASARGAHRRAGVFPDFGVEIQAAHYLSVLAFMRRALAGGVAPAELTEDALRLVDGVVARTRPVGRASRRSAGLRADTTALVAEVKADLLRHPSVAVDVGAIARLHGVPVYHLCRAFRAVAGDTVAGYSRRVRVLLSLEHLDHPESDVSRLAGEFGFASHSHFTMWFRRLLGVTPSEFRGKRRAARRALATGRLPGGSPGTR